MVAVVNAATATV